MLVLTLFYLSSSIIHLILWSASGPSGEEAPEEADEKNPLLCLEMLCKKRASLGIKDNEGRTACYLAIEHGLRNLAMFLMMKEVLEESLYVSHIYIDMSLGEGS